MRPTGLLPSPPVPRPALSVLVCLLCAVLVLPPRHAVAQYQAPSDRLVMSAQSATTWTQPGGTDVAQLEGPVRIELDRATLTARQAVVWIRPDPTQPGARRVEVALIGDAKVEQKNATRSGERMVVTAEVAGKIQLRAEVRTDRDASDTALYRAAAAMLTPAVPDPQPQPEPGRNPFAPDPGAPLPPTRPAGPTDPTQPTETIPAGPGAPPRRPTTGAADPDPRPIATGPAGAPAGVPAPVATTRPAEPVRFEAPELETVDTDEGTVAITLAGGVTLSQSRANGDFIELQADRAVLFTPFKDLREMAESARNAGEGGRQRGQVVVSGAYLEGDVRINFQPTKTPNNEQRLSANRVYYEFATDRAVLTDAVIRTVEPKMNVPVVIRAKSVRQLSQGEYRAEGGQLSTSQFAVPSYAINVDKVYVRQEPAAVEGDPDRFLFEARDTTFRTFGLPVFYLPYLGGTMNTNQTPLRAIALEQSQAFGTSFLSEWGLFETFGQQPPRDLDLSYRADYYSDRGPATGLNARYQGGFITETAREPFSFEGQFKSYFVYDEGADDIGRPLLPRPEDDYRFRGRILFEHQHYFPDNWQAQVRAGYVTDPTFLEQWFPREFDQGLPLDATAYVKRQEDNEAFTLLVQLQPSDLVTSSEFAQEQREVERLPEVGYFRFGDSLLPVNGRDRATFSTANTLGVYRFSENRATLADQGYFPPSITPGLPSFGTTGVTEDAVVRGDFRQELAFPLDAGRFKVVPYVVGRYTAYSDSPDGDAKHRLLAGAGTRVTTSFWKVYDEAQSDLFDVHRVRHVVEPELNLFTAAQTEERSDVFVFDEQVDAVNDFSVASLALRQRWQTYRGGPGRWRSVDFFTLNVEAMFFANEPADRFLRPRGFRGLFFPSLPEASIARDSINVDATWRISDNMVVLADASENVDGRARLATASVGLVARRDERMTYFVGNRYIADLDSNITTAAIEYQLSPKYTVLLAQSFDFSQSENVASEIGVTRRFDSFLVVFKAFRNETTDQNGFGINVFPYGLGYGVDTAQFESVLNRRR